MWIKICANTTVEDAQCAADLGADALGFVLAPSKRRVTAEEAGAIVAKLTGTTEYIGVFHDGDAGEIARSVETAGFTGVQLHGGFDPGLVMRLREVLGGGVAITQVLHWEAGEAGSQAAERLEGQVAVLRQQGIVRRVLVDSKVGKELGGTGQTFDWKAANELFGASGMQMIVAGGLTDENVSLAVERLAPWGVDVASGVESVPGRKDLGRLAAFIRNARLSSTKKPHDEP